MSASVIYQIRHIASGQRYIGSAKRWPHRWGVHLYYLRRDRHHSSPLQSLWNRDGEAAFLAEVIEHCATDHLVPREQWYIDNWKPELNVAPIAGSPMLGRRHSAETKEKMRRARLANPDRFYKHSPEALAKISEASKRQKGKPISDAKRAAMLRNLARGREKSRANKPGWIPTHCIGTRHSDETKAKIAAARRAFHARKRPDANTRMADAPGALISWLFT